MVRAGLSTLYIISHLILRKILLRKVVASPLYRNGSKRLVTCLRHTASEGTHDFKTQDPGSRVYAVAKTGVFACLGLLCKEVVFCR